MSKKRLIIIGGGISGLSAGVYGQLSGFETTILEKHHIVGGQCTGWERKGFHIDNCIHWLTGSNPNKCLYKIWERVGALGPGVEMIKNDSLIRIDGKDGNHYHVWRDLKKMKEEMLKLAPEDKDVIEEYIDAIDRYRDVEVFGIPIEQYSLWDYIRLFYKMRRVGKVTKKYSKISIADFREKFKNPLLRRAVDVCMPDHFYAEALFYTYGTFVSSDGDIPKGGSRATALRMQKRFEELGGQTRLNTPVEDIIIDKSTHCATAVKLSNGEEIEADFVIAATDVSVTLRKLLGGSVKDNYFTKRFKDKKNYPIGSHMVIYFGCNCRPENMPDTVAFEEEPITLCNHQIKLIVLKHYMYEESFAPKGKCVMQVMLVQDESDFDFWENLYNNSREKYKEEKNRVAEAVRINVEKHFPELKEQLETVEILTPYSFHKWTGAYKGSYMSFITTKYIKPEKHHGRVPGIKNIYLAGQWVNPPGGLPNALTSGKFAVQRICKDHKIKFIK